VATGNGKLDPAALKYARLLQKLSQTARGTGRGGQGRLKSLPWFGAQSEALAIGQGQRPSLARVSLHCIRSTGCIWATKSRRNAETVIKGLRGYFPMSQCSSYA